MYWHVQQKKCQNHLLESQGARVASEHDSSTVCIKYAKGGLCSGLAEDVCVYGLWIKDGKSVGQIRN